MYRARFCLCISVNCPEICTAAGYGYAPSSSIATSTETERPSSCALSHIYASVLLFMMALSASRFPISTPVLASSAAIRILVNSSATSVNCHPARPESAVIARNTPQRSEQMLFIRPLGTSARTSEHNSAAAHKENKYRRIASITRSPPSKSMPPRRGSSTKRSPRWPACSPWRRRGSTEAPREAS